MAFNDNGASWTQMKNALNAGLNTDRASFAVTPIAADSRECMWALEIPAGRGESGAAVSHGRCIDCDQREFHRSDSNSIAPATRPSTIVAIQPSAPNAGTTMSFIRLPENPMSYISAARITTVMTDSETTVVPSFVRRMLDSHFTDMTWDATTNPTPPGNCCQPNAIAPNGIHPDLVTRL